jgi:DNA-directed RNA polymerase subunit F
MNEERRKILDMLAEGKISVDEAEKLLAAIATDEASQEQSDEDSSADSKSRFKYLRVQVEPGSDSGGERVNIRVPLKLIRAGLKWAAFMPKHVQGRVDEALHEKGIDMDFSSIKPEDLEELVTNLNDLTVNVEGKETVKIFCE